MRDAEARQHFRVTGTTGHKSALTAMRNRPISPPAPSRQAGFAASADTLGENPPPHMDPKTLLRSRIRLCAHTTATTWLALPGREETV